MTPAKPSARSAAHRAAATLRDEILAREDGELLGSEDQLMELLGVSRPTLRQTARMLEHEQVLTVRRGVKGGYYARKPNVGSVAHVAAFYLRARGTTLGEIFLSFQPLFEAAIRRAASLADASAREKALARFTRLEPPRSTASMLEQETAFQEAVLELSGNAPIELFVRILNQFGLSQTGARVFSDRPDRVRDWSLGIVRVAEAIIAGDGEMAVLLSRRRGRALVEWMTADFGQEVAAEMVRRPEEA